MALYNKENNIFREKERKYKGVINFYFLFFIIIIVIAALCE